MATTTLPPKARGYDSVWAAESYGSDAVSMLGWLAPQTTTIGLGASLALRRSRET